jgi:hypothetical protein
MTISADKITAATLALINAVEARDAARAAVLKATAVAAKAHEQAAIEQANLDQALDYAERMTYLAEVARQKLQGDMRGE